MATVGFFQHPPSVRSRTIPTGTEDASVAVHVFAVLLSVVLIAMPVPVASQTQNSSTPSASEEPNAPEGDRNQSYVEAATDPDVSNADLRKMLTPLTAAQISQVTEGWQIILQENVQRTVDLQRSLKNLDNAETQIARRNLVELDDDRSRIQRNYSSALQAWTKKGGSVEETKPYRDYLTALTSELIYVTDNWALVESAVRWTFSTSGGLDFIKKIGIVVFSIWAIRLAARVLARMSKKALDRQRELSEALERCCQTNSNQSQFAAETVNLSGTKLTPLAKSGGACQLEGVPAGERSFLVEVVVDRGMDGGEFLQTSHAPETLHRALTSSKRQVRVLDSVVEPPARLLFFECTQFSERGSV
ncbi:hypothetical protein RUM4293_00108 [Ruegeria atlantica]|uniref:Uncharacterized protein n=1 Tax=Ruegeria atlantica TaxID=81569 RepID=A0A0P1E1C4_9RHOB|nr:hypothetical protein RUM4293_00108 [Ruegeria atlantica]